jgi:hypothetical protein
MDTKDFALGGHATCSDVVVMEAACPHPRDRVIEHGDWEDGADFFGCLVIGASNDRWAST